METVKFGDAPFYSAPDHDDVVARRLQGGEASGAAFALVGHSTLRDGAIIPMDSAPIGKIYVVTEGAIVIEPALVSMWMGSRTSKAARGMSWDRSTASTYPPTRRAPCATRAAPRRR